MKIALLLLLLSSCGSCPRPLGDMFKLAKDNESCILSEQITSTSTYYTNFIICPQTKFLEILNESNSKLRESYKRNF